MGAVKLPQIFQNGMMFQRNKAIKIWGEAFGEDVIVAELGKDRREAVVKEGRFFLELPKREASEGLTLTLYGKEGDLLVTIDDIYVGDIWIAAGQSNMEYFLRYDAHWEDIKKQKKNPHIRMYNTPQIAYSGQIRDLPDSGSWFGEGDPQWETFSAPGYAFAREIWPDLLVPIGIIGCNWGGTPACAWMDQTYLENEELRVFLDEYEEALACMKPDELKKKSMESWEFEDSFMHQVAWRAMMYGMNEADQAEWMKHNKNNPQLPMGPYHHYRPCGLYEEMVKTIAPFSVKGVLWYQGESDASHAELYDKTFGALIQCWRDTWQDKLPFLFVQLAPFGKWLDCEGGAYPQVRYKQEMVSKTVEDAWMISIMDLGMYEDIHPKQKREVGERLALLARGKVYGADILCESPEFYAVKWVENEVTLSFLHTGDTLQLKGNRIHALTISQGGQVVDILNYEITEQVKLSIQEVPKEALTISFAWEPYCEVNLFNAAGLPVKPFLTTCTKQEK